jgi:hypothetical protein
MSRLDPDHSAALDLPVIRPFRFALIDFGDEPMRLTDCPYGVAFSDTGDEDLDGHTYSPIDNQPIGVSDVQLNERGADTVTFTLSAIIVNDSEIMTEFGNLANYRGRVVRLWRAMFNDSFQMYGRPDAYFTGYMNVPTYHFAKDGSVIQLTAESYLASLTQASNRTYLSQAEFDSGDHSAEAAIAIANGTDASNLTTAALGIATPDPFSFTR